MTPDNQYTFKLNLIKIIMKAMYTPKFRVGVRPGCELHPPGALFYPISRTALYTTRAHPRRPRRRRSRLRS
jgi:hypothetical protein